MFLVNFNAKLKFFLVLNFDTFGPQTLNMN